jgi:2C-methyl-D-erythritol 2,4-cyclodiphosphate synthase
VDHKDEPAVIQRKATVVDQAKATENLARALNIPTDKIGLTATTLEGLGFVGREEGICVHATATLISI